MILILVTLTDLPYITVAIECVIVIGYPYHHRNIMTTKMVYGMVITIWVVSAVLVAAAIAMALYDILWPCRNNNYCSTVNSKLITIHGPVKVITAVLIIATNIFLYNKGVLVDQESSRKYETDGRGQEETK